MTPEAWAIVARELNTVRQLAHNWLTQEQAVKIARHLTEARRILRGGSSTKAKGRDPRARGFAPARLRGIRRAVCVLRRERPARAYR